MLDNWKSDKYDWDKEIVLITGGAGGIGGHVVRLLAERGIKVVVLDVIPMSFETRMDSLSRNIVSSLHLQQQMSITTNAT